MRQSQEAILSGGRIGCFSGSLARIFEDCQALRPTVFAATPAFWGGVLRDFDFEVSKDVARGEGADVKDQILSEWRDRRMLGNRIQVVYFFDLLLSILM